MAEIYDKPGTDQIAVHPFPVTLEVTLTGKSAATDADVSLKRGTVLARIWDGGVAATLGDGEYKYSVLTNWTEIAQSAAEDTGTDSAVDDTFSGFLNNMNIDPTRVGFESSSTGTELVVNYIVDPKTGRFTVVFDTDLAASEDINAWYHYGDLDGGSNPVAILAKDVEIDSVDDIEDVPVYVLGGFNKEQLIFPSDADDDDAAGFMAVMEENGMVVK